MTQVGKYLDGYFGSFSLTANRLQQLVVTDSKHLFCMGDGEKIRYQQKELDHRTCGNRVMLTKVIAVDIDTGVFYGELHPRPERLDLVGFLARAWATKDRTPMRGAPRLLSVPHRVVESEDLLDDVRFVAELSDTRLVPGQGGFSQATSATREYERQVAWHA